MPIQEILFVVVLIGLGWFFFIYLPKKTQNTLSKKDLESVIGIVNSEELCEQFHSHVWEKLHRPIQLEEVRGDNNPITYWHACNVCNVYRR